MVADAFEGAPARGWVIDSRTAAAPPRRLPLINPAVSATPSSSRLLPGAAPHHARHEVPGAALFRRMGLEPGPELIAIALGV